MIDQFAYSAFVGVNSGYRTTGAKITDHDEAAHLIRAYLDERAIDAIVWPARVAYLISRGSTSGGEPCGLLMLNRPDPQQAIAVFKDIKAHFDQVTVGVTCLTPLPDGAQPTRYFTTATDTGNLHEAAAAWQHALIPIHAKSGLEISAAFWLEDGRTRIASTINPLSVAADQWDPYHQAFQALYGDADYAVRDAFYRDLTDLVDPDKTAFTPQTAT